MKPETLFQGRVRSTSGLWSDRIEPASERGADPGFPDTIFYLDGELLPIEFKIGDARKDGRLIATIRPAQRIWFRRAFQFSIPCGVAIGKAKSETFWLVRAGQVELLYAGALNISLVKQVNLDTKSIISAFRGLKDGPSKFSSESSSDSARFGTFEVSPT